MISFDYLTLKAFYKENRDFFIGARLQKIQQPTRRDFVFTIRGFETRRLYINIDPQVFHVCFLSDESYSLRNILIPKKPPMFCMLMRKYLEGFRISGINVPQYERILEIFFESYNELNEKIELCLAVELMGKYSNVILYNRDTKSIIGCAHNVGSEKSRERELAGTLPYIYPQKQNKADVMCFNGVLDYKSLNDDFMGISKVFATQLEKNNISLSKLKEYVSLEAQISPAANGKEFSIYSELLGDSESFSSISEMIDYYYSEQQSIIVKRALRLKLKNIMKPLHSKELKLCETLGAQLRRKKNGSKYKKYADLIMANIYTGTDYSKQISVQDWETEENIDIKLDEKLTLKENAQKYYHLYSKSKSALERLEVLSEEALSRAEYYGEILYSIDKADTLNDLYGILSECEDLNLIKHQDVNRKKEINVESLDINGFKVYIGKNNKQNDLIVSKLSSPDDLWFHTQNCTGSHVLLKVTDSRLPDDKTIYECCKLAKKYSKASDSSKAGVIYTKRKYLRKPPKANPGYVTYKNEQEIIVND